MTGDEPQVSVILTMYQARDHVARALSSLRSQTFRDHEVVVVDDASRDGSADVAAAVADHRVRLIRLSRNVGPGAARNIALQSARAPWTTVLDADDVYHPERLALLHSHAAGLDGDVVVFDAVQHLTVRGGRLIPLRVSNRLPGVPLCPHAVTVDPATWLRSGRAVKPFMPTRLAREIGYPEGIRFGEDYLFLATLLADSRARMVQLRAPLYGYVLRPDSLRSDRGARAEFGRHLQRWLSEHRDSPCAAAVAEYALASPGDASRAALGQLRRAAASARVRASNVLAAARAAASRQVLWTLPSTSGPCRITEAGERPG